LVRVKTKLNFAKHAVTLISGVIIDLLLSGGAMERQTRSKNLILLTGMVAFLFLINALLALFALSVSNEKQLANVKSLGEIMDGLEEARSAQVHFKKQVQEWKNILLRGQKKEDFEKHQRAFFQEESAVDQQLEKLKLLADKLKIDVSSVEKILEAHQELGKRYRTALQNYSGENPNTIFLVDSEVRGIDRAPTDAMDNVVEQIQHQEMQIVSRAQEETKAQYSTWRIVLITGTSIGVILSFALLWLSFSRPAA
jgi:methyl-accepting chemotaxis protein